MVIYLGADHRGFNLKEQLKSFLKMEGYSINDMGAQQLIQDDSYVQYAKVVAEKISQDPNQRGILICGSGVGMDVTANKFYQVRSALVSSPDQALASRSDDDTNVLSLAADFIDLDTAKKIVSVWLQTPFSEEPRYKERLEELKKIDNTLN